MIKKEKIGYYNNVNIKNNVISFLEQHVILSANKNIFCWTNNGKKQKISYKDFYDQTKSIASGYNKLKIKKGDLVILLIPMTTDLYLAMFALQTIGAVPVFIESWSDLQHIMQCIKKTNPKAIISQNKIFSLLENLLIPKNFLKITIDNIVENKNISFQQLKKQKPLKKISPVKQDDLALITFTSGSSGEPKGVSRSHRFLASQHYALSRNISYGKHDIDLPVFPVFSLNNIASGITTVLPAFNIYQDNDKNLEIIVSQLLNFKVNCTTLSPFIFNALSKYCKKRKIIIHSLKKIITGGAPISCDNLINFKTIVDNAKIFVLYGSTEVEPITCIEANEVIKLNQHENKKNKLVDIGSNVGKVDKELKYKIIKIYNKNIIINNKNDWKKYEQSANNIGELIVSGEHVCKNYYKNQKALKEVKIFDTDGTIWHRSGDIVQIDKNGYTWILGRKHNIIKRFNQVFYPIKAEVILNKFFQVAESAFVGMPDKKLREKTVAIIVLKNILSKPKKLKLEKNIKAVFKKNNIPLDKIKYLEKIPRDHRFHSKINYGKLKEMLNVL